MNSLVLLQLFAAGLTYAQQLTVTPGRTITAQGSDLDPDNDYWWVDIHNRYSFQSLINLLQMPCDNEHVYETRFRYYNNAGQVYVRMTPEYIFTEFWYPYQFWSGYATTAQIFSNGQNNECYQCIADAGYQPESYNFKQQRTNSPNDNCWDECIGNNTFLNTGDTDQDPVFSWTFFEAEIFHDLSLSGQPPQAYRLPISNTVDLQVPHTFNRSLEIVLVSNAVAYSYISGDLIAFGDSGVPYVHGCWFREWTNPSHNEWVSPFRYNPPLPNPWNRNLRENTCFTWIASKDGATGKFGTLNEQYYIDEAGIACPNRIQCFTTTLPPTKRPTVSPTHSPPTLQPTSKPLAFINFEGIPCRSSNMDLFVIVDASKSITDQGLERQKAYVQQLFADTQAEFDELNIQMALQGYPDRVCFRPGIITFSHLTAMPMSISMWDCALGGYNPILGNALIATIGRPHPPTTRLAGTHIRDALDASISMHNQSNHSCTSFYGIALTDGEPQSVRSGPGTNQDPCLFPAFGAKLRYLLTDFFWVPVEREAPFNTELFSCLREQNALIPVTSTITVNLANWTDPVCEMCKNPTKAPTAPPTRLPTARPTTPPTKYPTKVPTNNPTPAPSRTPSSAPTSSPTSSPTNNPTPSPTNHPTPAPSRTPSSAPTSSPTPSPTFTPSYTPTTSPTNAPTNRPTKTPTNAPTNKPTKTPTKSPTTLKPTVFPTVSPTVCIPPPLNEGNLNCGCEVQEAEWYLELMDYKFDKHKDRTYVQYQVCVYARNPFVTCNDNEMPVALRKLFLQLPCNCDICIDYVTKDMDPDGFTTELDRGWVWELAVEPGECQLVELALQGHATLKSGFYQLLGMDERCVSDTILIPDICENITPQPLQHWHWESHEQENENEECDPREPLFLKNMCWSACDTIEQVEWSIEFVSSYFDLTQDTTTFVWYVNTSNNLPNPSCNLYDNHPAPLTDVTIRLGCDCEPQSDSYLSSITAQTTPSAVVHSSFWHFDNLNIRAGESARLEIILKGNVGMKNNGDATVGGGYRCGSTLTAVNPMSVTVPDPCLNRCNFGEWTDWEMQGDCSLECGGGKQARIRRCVSVCNDAIPVDNCPGEAHGTVPCNTQPCSVWLKDSRDRSSSKIESKKL
jgi:hypothetical protein